MNWLAEEVCLKLSILDKKSEALGGLAEDRRDGWHDLTGSEIQRLLNAVVEHDP
jgi:hypothetical protein